MDSNQPSESFTRSRRKFIRMVTAGSAAITVGQPWEKESPKTRIVDIGSRGGVDGSEISALFESNTPLSST